MVTTKAKGNKNVKTKLLVYPYTSVGAKVIKEPYQMGDAWISTLADPDGNYFQLMTPWDP
jgi:predicted lactoylglutathione lyase